MEYTVRQFRKSLKEALDKVDSGEGDRYNIPLCYVGVN